MRVLIYACAFVAPATLIGRGNVDPGGDAAGDAADRAGSNRRQSRSYQRL